MLCETCNKETKNKRYCSYEYKIQAMTSGKFCTKETRTLKKNHTRPWLGRHHTDETKVKLREQKLGPKNPRFGKPCVNKEAISGERSVMWRGDDVGMSALHFWARKYITKPELCVRCKSKSPTEISNDGSYKRTIDGWEWLCHACHIRKDGAIYNLKGMKR